MFLVGMGLTGFADGFGSLSLIRNCWKFFPTRKGLIHGIILSAVGLNTTFLTILADFVVINPLQLQPNSQGIYPEKVAQNFKSFIKFCFVLFFVLGVVAYASTFEYKEEDDDKSEGFVVNLNESGSSNNSGNTAILSVTTKNIQTTNKGSILGNFWEAFCSLKNVELTVFCFCGPCK